MAQFNMLNVAETAGRGAADRQMAEANDLAIDAARTEMDEDQRYQNTRWLAAASGELLRLNQEDPEQYQRMLMPIVNEGARRGIIDGRYVEAAKITPETLSDIHRQALIGLQEFEGAQSQQKQPTKIQEYEYARQQGYQGSLQDWMGETKSGVNVNMPPQYPRPESGWMYEYGEGGVPSGMVPIPGGPADRSIIEQQEKEAAQLLMAQQGAQFMQDEIGRAFERIGPGYGFLPATGAGGTIAANAPLIGPQTAAGELEGLIETITSRIGFDYLQEMRNASPTGGALGAISERELSALQAIAGNLNPNQPDWQLAYNMLRVWNKQQDIIHGVGNGQRYRIPENDLRVLYEEGKDDPEIAKTFYSAHGWLPPGFTTGSIMGSKPNFGSQ